MGRNDISTKGNMVVTAGAGTGKTTCLIEKIISLIGEAHIPVEKILAITFTKAAAAEMVERLRIEIEKRAGDEGGEVWKNARDDIERAQISTIHALAARILRENPIEAGIDPDFVIEEETGDILLNDELWETWAGQNLWGGHDFDDDLVLLLKRFNTEGIKTIGMELSKRPDRLDYYLIYRVDREAEREKFQKRLTALGERLSGINIEAKEDDLLYQKCIKAKEILALKTLEEMVESLEGLNLKKVGGREDKWSSFDTLTSIKEMFYQSGGVIDTLKELKPFLKQLEDHKVAETAVRIISEFVRFLREEKIKRGLLTYFDLLYEAKRLLQENPEIRSRYQREFDYILVDEFQDTDPIQGDMILFLAEEGSDAERPEDVKIKGDRLFIVGDPKQSIFRFREAEIGVFYNVAEKINETGGGELVLSKSYRSQNHLIEFLNAFFADYINHVDDNYSIDYNPLTPKVEDTPQLDAKKPTVDIVISDISDSAEKVYADDARENEAEYIASRILNMVEGQAEGSFIRDRTTKQPRAVNYGDIAILMRKMTAVSIYEGALKREEVPYIIVGGKGYFQRQEIYDLINILGAILDPTDKKALVGILRSPVFGIDDGKICRLAEGGKLNYRESAGDDQVEKTFEVLRYLHKIRGGKTLSGLIDELFTKTEIMEINAFGTGGSQRVGNLMKIGRIARELESTGPVTLTSFIHLLRELVVGGPDEGEAVITEEVENSVKIMTLHKAKGLEFPVVFLPDLGGRMNTQPRNGIYMDNLNGNAISGIKTDKISDIGYYNYFEEKEKIRNLAEERRLFYVGASRSRDRLILLGQKDGAKDGHMKRILEFAGFDGLVGEDGKVEFLSDYPFIRSVAIGGKKSNLDKKVSITKKLSKISDFIEGKGNTKPIDEARRREQERKEEYERALSVSLYGSVTGEAKDISEALKLTDPFGGELSEGDGPQKTFAGGLVPPPSTGDAAMAVGSLLHAALEGIDFTNPPGDEDIEGLVQGASVSLMIDGDIRNEVLSETKELVKKFLSSDKAREIAISEIVGREVPIITSRGEKTLAGRIDLIYRRGSEIVILDYKTDSVGAGGEAEAAEKYRGQMETYIKVVTAALGGYADDITIRGAVHFIRSGVTVPVFTTD